ncbi:hypothetical protein NCC49_004372 [Naganishia albida]|nr:hypothetical protein NCC49_004372 [Naganishia albida]
MTVTGEGATRGHGRAWEEAELGDPDERLPPRGPRGTTRGWEFVGVLGEQPAGEAPGAARQAEIHRSDTPVPAQRSGATIDPGIAAAARGIRRDPNPITPDVMPDAPNRALLFNERPGNREVERRLEIQVLLARQAALRARRSSFESVEWETQHSSRRLGPIDEADEENEER